MNPGKSIFNIKNVLRVLFVLLIVFVFCPTFFVSCSGESIGVSAIKTAFGFKVEGTKITDAHPLLLVVLVIPIAAIVLLTVKGLVEKLVSGIVLGISVVDLIVWFVFRANVKEFAEDSYCQFKTGFFFVITIIFLIISILLCLLVVIGIFHLDADFANAGGPKTQKAFNQMSATMNRVSGSVTNMTGNMARNIANKAQKDAIGFCAKCGSAITYGNTFCMTCGTPVPQDMIAEAEAKRRAAEQQQQQMQQMQQQQPPMQQMQQPMQQPPMQQQPPMPSMQQPQQMQQQPPMQQMQQQPPMMSAPNGGGFCQNCGAKLLPGAVFCDSCGTRVQ